MLPMNTPRSSRRSTQPNLIARIYLDAKMTGAKPSYGHVALATLMRAQLTRLVWTTNFDSLIADACAKVYDGTGPLTTVALDAPELATQCIAEGRWPVEIKLHGDFRSRRLKNTGDELRHQDARLRQVLVDSCRRFGLVVAGYSGRDDSIMDALEEAVGQGPVLSRPDCSGCIAGRIRRCAVSLNYLRVQPKQALRQCS